MSVLSFVKRFLKKFQFTTCFFQLFACQQKAGLALGREVTFFCKKQNKSPDLSLK